MNLIKPAGTDFVNVADLNSNFDIIDTAVGDLQESVSSLSSSVTNLSNKTQSGTATLTVPGNTSINSWVSFPHAYSSPPNVVISPLTSIPGSIFATVAAIYTGGFYYYVKNNTSGQGDMITHWMANGQ